MSGRAFLSVVWCWAALGCVDGGADPVGGDSGVSADADETSDAGSRLDAGASRADTGLDLGQDLGLLADLGLAADAGAFADLGVAADASVSPDAGALADAAPMDAAATDAAARDAGASPNTPGPGDLVIVELQGNPVTANDSQAEYLELLNVSGRSLELMGVRIAHLDWAGAQPARSASRHTIARSVMVAPGERALLASSNGGYFGTARPDYVYSGFELSNGGTRQNRLRLMTPAWDGTEPPAADQLIDEVVTAAAVFDNALRGRALQLDPGRVPNPTAATNDAPADWCTTTATAGLAYWSTNYGTPRDVNRCR